MGKHQVPRRAINRTSLRGLINDSMRNIGQRQRSMSRSQRAVMCGVEALGYRLLITLPEFTDGERKDKQNDLMFFLTVHHELTKH